MANAFCACSTPNGASGIAVIRISGEDSRQIVSSCSKILRAQTPSIKTVMDMPGYSCAFAMLFDPETKEKIDDVVITCFIAPNSYTGEDLVEISCHGSFIVKEEILRVLVSLGARPALPGEFTKTAFTNGKLDLSQAEAVMDVIGSESKRELNASNIGLMGEISKRLMRIEGEIYRALSLIEMIVEFPEHDDTPENSDEVLSIITSSRDDLVDLKRSYKKGRVLKESLKVALCGLPNSGKSSLLNCLTGYDRAIVTEIEGTTRDTLEVRIDINGIPVTLIDTAGIRKTSDMVEQIGVERAMKATSECDLVLYLIDPDTSLNVAEKMLSDILANGVEARNVISIFSKADKKENEERLAIEEFLEGKQVRKSIEISCVTRININELCDAIEAFYEELGGSSRDGDVIILNMRHEEAICRAIEKMDMAISVMNDEIGVDVASSILRLALEIIGEITGKTVSQELADQIFGRFCIGK